nr:MAG TPA: hypothetical protein [Caudoviricetes sp.]
MRQGKFRLGGRKRPCRRAVGQMQEPRVQAGI